MKIENDGPAPVAVFMARHGRLVLFASAAAVVAALAWVIFPPTADPLSRIAEARYRSIPARLSGFAYAPMIHDQASTPDSGHVKAASDLQLRLERDRSAANLHRAALAALAVGKPRTAVAYLREAEVALRDHPDLLSDLAGALLSIGNSHEAVETAARAIELDPRRPAAVYNLALALEASGAADAAVDAWRRYLLLDSESAWATEARAHQDGLASRAALSWDEMVAQLSADPPDKVVRDTVRDCPQRVRYWMQDILLPSWADDARSEQLALAIRIAAVRAATGDPFLRDVVDNASRRRPALLDGLRQFGRARAATRARNLEEARRALEISYRLLRKEQSPLAAVAAIYLAANRFYGGIEPAHVLRTVAEATEIVGPAPERYPAVSAQIEWVRGLTLSRDGRPSEALAAYRRALGLARMAHETEDEISIASLLAGVLATTGDIEGARTHRLEVLRRAHSASIQDERAYNIYQLAAESELQAGYVRLALAYNRSQLAVATRVGDPMLRAESQSARAMILWKIGRAPEAQQLLAQARESAAMIRASVLRDRTIADLNYVDGFVSRLSNPAHASAVLGETLEISARYRWPNRAAAALLARGETHLQLGDARSAETDFRAGIEQIERIRKNVTETSLRVMYFESAERLFNRLIKLLLVQRRDSEALGLAERKRARTLFEETASGVRATPLDSISIVDALRSDQALVEYAVLDEELVIFAVRNGQLNVVGVPMNRDELENEIRMFLAAIASNDPSVRARGSSLYQKLMAPVSATILPAGQVVIVPDGLLHALPFGALVKQDSYLAEAVTTRLAPSASFFVRELPAKDADGSVVSFAVPAPSPELRPLSHAEDEAIAIGELHHGEVLLGNAVTVNSFLTSIRDARVIHFAGHATALAGQAAPAALLLNDGGMIEAETIAKQHLRHTPLVVLAACNTARGKIWRNEGIGSLATAFLHAGAHGVIGTLWDINDETSARLFRRFHQHLQRGVAPAEALRMTQLDMLHSNDSIDQQPSSWAGVFLVGAQ